MGNRSIIAGAVAAVLLLGGLTACGGDDGGSAGGSGKVEGTVTLQTWSLTPKFTDYLNGLIDGFKKQYPGTDVKLLDQPGDGYAEKVLSQASAGTLPDVINLPPDFALPLARQDLLVDLAKEKLDLKATYVAGGIDAYRFKGTGGVFGYPWYLNTDVNYWNSAKFKACGLDPAKPPATQQELFTQARTMHDKCPQEYLMSRKPKLGDFALEGIPVLSDDGKKFVFNTDKAVSLLDTYRDAYKNGLMPNTVLNSDYLGNSKLFTEGKVAWTTGGANSLADFEKDNPSLRGNVVVSKALNTPPLYVQGVSVSKKSKNVATAVALAQWVTNATNQNAFGHLVNIFPSTLSSKDDPYFAKDDGTEGGKARSLAFEALKTARALTPYEINSAMDTLVDQQIALAIKGDVTSRQALDDTVSKLNTMLARQ
jgi:multiple sugar transport system substrate-binding protein